VSAIFSRLARSAVSRNFVASTFGKNTVFPSRPCVSGYAPVAIEDAFTRVTVG
jgi:hypothetical protein